MRRQLLASVRMNGLHAFSSKPTPSSFHNLFQGVSEYISRNRKINLINIGKNQRSTSLSCTSFGLICRTCLIWRNVSLSLFPFWSDCSFSILQLRWWRWFLIRCTKELCVWPFENGSLDTWAQLTYFIWHYRRGWKHWSKWGNIICSLKRDTSLTCHVLCGKVDCLH